MEPNTLPWLTASRPLSLLTQGRFLIDTEMNRALSFGAENGMQGGSRRRRSRDGKKRVQTFLCCQPPSLSTVRTQRQRWLLDPSSASRLPDGSSLIFLDR